VLLLLLSIPLQLLLLLLLLTLLHLQLLLLLLHSQLLLLLLLLMLLRLLLLADPSSIAAIFVGLPTLTLGGRLHQNHFFGTIG